MLLDPFNDIIEGWCQLSVAVVQISHGDIVLGSQPFGPGPRRVEQGARGKAAARHLLIGSIPDGDSTTVVIDAPDPCSVLQEGKHLR